MVMKGKEEVDAMARTNNKEKDKEKIKNKISIAKPNFSLAVETNESLYRAKEIFEELMGKYRK